LEKKVGKVGLTKFSYYLNKGKMTLLVGLESLKFFVIILGLLNNPIDIGKIRKSAKSLIPTLKRAHKE